MVGLGSLRERGRARVWLADDLWTAVSGPCKPEQKFGSVMLAEHCSARVLKTRSV